MIVHKTLIFEHPHCGATAGMRQAHDGACAFGEQRGVDRMLGHQIGNKLETVDRIEGVSLGESHAKEFAREAIPEGRTAAFIEHAAQFGENALGKAQAVRADVEITAAREQHAEAAGAFIGMEEQPADFTCAFEVCREREHFGAEGAVQLG